MESVLEPRAATLFPFQFMRILPFLLLPCLVISALASEWRSEIFHCAANIPDSGGWQMIDAPPAPGIAPVLTMQNAARQAVFGISVIEKYKEANLSDPAIQKDLEAMLRQFGYQFIGHSTVKAGGFDWLQYPVRAGAGAQQVSGIIRYASAGGSVFGITMLRGGGQEASQDAELQRAAASFRLLPADAIAATGTGGRNGKTAQGTPLQTQGSAGEKSESDKESPEDAAAAESRTRMIWYGGGGVLVLLIFLGIMGGGAKKR